MTYHNESKSPSKRILSTLVVITIALVAYWAANGGLDQIGTGG